MRRILAGFALALGATAAAAQGAGEPAIAARLLESARQLERAGQVEQARARYEEILERAADSAVAADALLALARLDWPVADADAIGRAGFDPSGLARARARLETLRREYAGAAAAAEGIWRLALIELDPVNPARHPAEAQALLGDLIALHPT